MPIRPRAFALLSLLGALLAASICKAQENELVTVGGVQIILPAPAGFKASQAARTVFGPLVLPEGRLLSAYASPEDTVKLEQGQAILIPRYMLVQTPRFAEALEMTPELFAQFAKTVSDNHQQLAAQDQALVSELAARLSQASGQAVSLGLGKLTSRGIFLSRPEAFGWALVAPVKLTVADQTFSADVVGAVAAVHIGTKVVMTYVYAELHEALDLGWVKSTTTDWVNAITAANATTPPKAATALSPFDAPGVVHVHEATDGFTPPELIQEVKPMYSADALAAKVEGIVRVECIVKTDGTVGNVRVTRSLDKFLGLDDEAIKAAKKWTFKPGRKNGVAVPVLVELEFTFALRK